MVGFTASGCTDVFNWLKGAGEPYGAHGHHIVDLWQRENTTNKKGREAPDCHRCFLSLLADCLPSSGSLAFSWIAVNSYVQRGEQSQWDITQLLLTRRGFGSMRKLDKFHGGEAYQWLWWQKQQWIAMVTKVNLHMQRQPTFEYKC